MAVGQIYLLTRLASVIGLNSRQLRGKNRDKNKQTITTPSAQSVRFRMRMEVRTRLKSRIKTLYPIKSDKGFLLTAALTLLSLLILMGTTAYLLTSTDIKISRNFRNTQSVLQVAIGGAERAKEALRQENISSSNPASFNEELANSSRHGPNNALDGYTPTTDDVPIVTGTLNRVSYSAYLTNDFADGISNTTDSNHKVMITSVATGPDNSKAIVQIVVALFSLPLTPGPGALYSKDNVSLSGSSINISGTNACDPASSLPPVYTLNPATTTLSGSPQLSGNPPTPQTGSINIDIDSYVEARKDFATTILTADVSNATYGSSSNYVTVYSDATQQGDGELRLNNVTGYGILAVKGNLQLSGNINWTGIILVTGIIRSTGGGSNSKNIVGQIYSGSSLVADSVVSGGVTVGYDSCKVQEAIKGQPFKVRNWKQSY
jgi:Tfp pilus assembly protein PilX